MCLLLFVSISLSPLLGRIEQEEKASAIGRRVVV